MGTTNHDESLPNVLPKQIEALQAEIAALTEQRRQLHLFLDVKAEEQKIVDAKAQAEAIVAQALKDAASIAADATIAAAKEKKQAADDISLLKSLAEKNLQKAKETVESLKADNDALEAREKAVAQREYEVSVKDANLAEKEKAVHALIDSIQNLRA